MKHFVIIGGGAAGFFAAINTAEKNPNLKITVLEAGKEVLQKVKVSGGGRCNVTHACFEPKELVQFYPRGKKELLGPFHQFMTGDVMQWFEDRGIHLKIEKDNRVFPESNSSQTIIDCFLNSAKANKVEILKNQRVLNIEKVAEIYHINTKTKKFKADYVLIAAGSSPKIWKMVETLGHNIVAPVPSLFTFNIKDEKLITLPGTVAPNASVQIKDTKLKEQGALLITHWGMSGPGILKLSAVGARILHDKNYQFKISVNWLSKPQDEIISTLEEFKQINPKKKVISFSTFSEISKRLWHYFVAKAEIDSEITWNQLAKKKQQKLVEILTHSVYTVNGKSTFKDEFVTAGGVKLKEINFKRFESKIHQNLFFAGEILNIDAITGGFNFQNAWTGAWMVSESVKH